jgi:hypothetical protein
MSVPMAALTGGCNRHGVGGVFRKVRMSRGPGHCVVLG